MEPTTPITSTVEKLSGPCVRQFTIFLPNKVGVLSEIIRMLHERDIHALALNIQDSADCAIVRMIVSDPEQAEELFELHDVSFSCSKLLVAELREGVSDLPKLLSSLLMAEVNIHGSYGLLTRPNGRAALALHVEDNDCATGVLISHGFRLLSQTDLSR
jgi:hypothetical protein